MASNKELNDMLVRPFRVVTTQTSLGGFTQMIHPLFPPLQKDPGAPTESDIKIMKRIWSTTFSSCHEDVSEYWFMYRKYYQKIFAINDRSVDLKNGKLVDLYHFMIATGCYAPWMNPKYSSPTCEIRKQLTDLIDLIKNDREEEDIFNRVLLWDILENTWESRFGMEHSRVKKMLKETAPAIQSFLSTYFQRKRCRYDSDSDSD